jgi:hypothetical protein
MRFNRGVPEGATRYLSGDALSTRGLIAAPVRHCVHRIFRPISTNGSHG